MRPAAARRGEQVVLGLLASARGSACSHRRGDQPARIGEAQTRRASAAGMKQAESF
jgi:hypothetical protein